MLGCFLGRVFMRFLPLSCSMCVQRNEAICCSFQILAFWISASVHTWFMYLYSLFLYLVFKKAWKNVFVLFSLISNFQFFYDFICIVIGSVHVCMRWSFLTGCYWYWWELPELGPIRDRSRNRISWEKGLIVISLTFFVLFCYFSFIIEPDLCYCTE